MNVSTQKGVDAAKAKQQQVEATQNEQADITEAEQIGGENVSETGDHADNPAQEAEQQEVEQQKVEDPRTSYMNELVQQQRQERDERLNADRANNNQKPITSTVPEQEEDFEEDEPAGEVAQTPENDVNLNEPGFYGDKILVKIDGQMVEMSPEKALSILQKNESGDKKLEQVALREQRLTQQEQQFQLRQQQQPPSQGVVKANSAEVQKEVAQFATLLEEGETEEAIKHLTNALQSRQPAASTQQITQQVKAQLVREQADNLESRLKKSGDYDDIFNNQDAYDLTLRNISKLSQDGHQGSLEDKILESIELVRDFRSGGTREERLARKGQDDKTNSRQQRKANSQRPISSNTQAPRKAVKRKEEPTREQTRANLFAQQKANRNQA